MNLLKKGLTRAITVAIFGGVYVILRMQGSGK